MHDGQSLSQRPLTIQSHVERRVLIVDDDVDFAETLADILEDQGVKIHLSHNSKQALESVGEFNPHVALLDIRLGHEESGTELISSLMALQPQLQCIMMTGYAALETAILALKKGAYDYMRKPINPDDLFATLRRVFQTVDLQREKERADDMLAERNRELENINERLRKVVSAAKRLAAIKDYSRLLPQLLEEFSHIVGAHGGSIYVIQNDHLKLMHTLELPHAPTEIPLPLHDRSVFQHVHSSGEVLLIEDFNRQQDFLNSQWDGYENGSSLVFPIRNEDGQAYALISLHNKEKPPFTEQDKEIGSVLLSLCGEVLRTQKAFLAVESSRRRFRELSDLLPAMVFELDCDGRFAYLNREVFNMTGYEPDALIGKRHIFELFEEDDNDAFNCKVNRRPLSRDFTLVRADGEKRIVLLEAVPIVRHDQSQGTRGLLFDITERKLAEMEHAQLAKAVEQAAELILITDVNGRIGYANPAYLELTGYSQEEVQTLNFHSFENAKEDPSFYENLWETLNRGQVWNGRVSSRKLDGTIFVSEASISPLRDSSGHVSNYVAVLRDLTNEANLEARLRQAEKLEAIGTLAGGIAHDFNNILSPIIGFTEIVREDLPAHTEEVAHLDKVLNACHTAKELVSRILTFSRQVETERKAVAVHHIISDAMKLLRPSIPKTISITEDVISSKGVVLADPAQIHQIIMNLATNAYHAMDDHGTLRIGLHEIFADKNLQNQVPRLKAGDEYLCLLVEDTGKGMDRHTLSRIFDPFFSTKEAGKGTGLGLATVHGIVSELKGDIQVESLIGHGTSIRVYLPIHRDETLPGQIDESGEIRRGKGRILFVDDEKMILELGEMMLMRLGYEVDCYHDSPEALEWVRRNPDRYDLIITDMTMPAMTGQELASEIKKIRADIPILLTTGFSSLVKEDQLAACGIECVLHKPFTRKQLGKAIELGLMSVSPKN